MALFKTQPMDVAFEEMFAVEPLCNAPLARDRNERSRRRERRRSYAFPRR